MSEQGGSAAAPHSSQMQSPSRATTGQSSSERSSQSGQDQGRSFGTQATPRERSDQSSSPTGRASQDQSGSRSERNAESTSQNPSGASGTSRSTTASAPAGERVNLSSQQKTQIWTQVLEHGNAPRVSHVDFNVGVGVAVPTTVRLAPVPPVLIEIHPAWRSYEYFVYNDEVIIVEPHNRHIVEVIVLS